jgi:UDPglucose 6-dehydrogenase
MKIGIVGYGTVGSSLDRMLSKTNHNVFVYDKYLPGRNRKLDRSRVQRSDLVFVAVPTPGLSDGHCDLTAVEDAVSWISAPICIKSTVPPGTTDRLIKATQKSIVFSPEFVGETVFHPYRQCPFDEYVIVGGQREQAERVLFLYQTVLGPLPQYFLTSAVTAELTKYMENCFFATKITLVAQFHSLATLFGADFHQMREAWLADSRIGRSHSAIIDQPGFGGRCLPKDLNAIIEAAHDRGHSAKLLEAVRDYNDSVRGAFKGKILISTTSKITRTRRRRAPVRSETNQTRREGESLPAEGDVPGFERL